MDDGMLKNIQRRGLYVFSSENPCSKELMTAFLGKLKTIYGVENPTVITCGNMNFYTSGSVEDAMGIIEYAERKAIKRK